MSWINQNTKKQVFSITRPIEEENLLKKEIPENGIMTSYTKNTKTVKVTYVIQNELTLDDIVRLNRTTVKPVKLDRVASKSHKNTAKTKRINCIDNVMAVLNIADFHLNRRVFGNESYGDDYDLNKASEVFYNIIDNAIIRLKSNAYNIDKIILNLCGDFFNSDTITGTTTSGTYQVDDVTWKQSFKRATELLEYALLKLSNIAPVEMYYIMGNHDEQAGYYLTSWLNARFKDIEYITVDDNPNIRQTVKYYNNVIIFTHGSTEGQKAIDLPFIEPESIKSISDATNIEVISGHLHSNAVKTKNGVYWEILNSACPVQDVWSHSKGFDGLNQEATINYYNETGRIQKDNIDTVQIYKASFQEK